MKPQAPENKKLNKIKYLAMIGFLLTLIFWPSDKANLALAGFGGGRNLAPDDNPIEKQRGVRRGNPRFGRQGPSGNEGSDRPDRPAQFGRPQKDRQREDQDNRQEQALNGCPDGTMSVSVAPDNLSFSILFDQFVAKTDATKRGMGGQMALMRCYLLIPLQIPDGMRMTITSIDYRGYSKIPQGSVGMLRSTYAFVGANGLMQSRFFEQDDRPRPGRGGPGGPGGRFGNANVNFMYTFNGPVDDNYLLSTDAAVDRDATSPCGGSAQLALRNVVRIQNQKGPADAMLTVDSIDGNTQLVYNIRWDRCTN